MYTLWETNKIDKLGDSTGVIVRASSRGAEKLALNRNVYSAARFSVEVPLFRKGGLQVQSDRFSTNDAAYFAAAREKTKNKRDSPRRINWRTVNARGTELQGPFVSKPWVQHEGRYWTTIVIKAATIATAAFVSDTPRCCFNKGQHQYLSVANFSNKTCHVTRREPAAREKYCYNIPLRVGSQFVSVRLRWPDPVVREAR